ncbi:hypothetical protein TNCV_2157711 [Trichonephila clavipes]|nr:hypothetical protein TNCV_2157711 [Trichonephila clavipes]
MESDQIDHLGVDHRILIIRNTLTFKSIEFPLRSAIVRVSVVTFCLPPISLPIPVRETIVLALVCISEFLTRTPHPSI